MQSNVVALSCVERLGGCLDADDLHVAALEQLPDALALPFVVFDDEHAAEALGELRFEPLERLDQLLALDRLQRVADRAELERLLRVVGDRDDVDRDVARLRIALELIEHAEAGVIRQIDVEQDRAGLVLRGRREPVVRRVRHDALEAELVRQVAQDRRETRVVFDDQDASGPRAADDRGRRRTPPAPPARPARAARLAAAETLMPVRCAPRASRRSLLPARLRRGRCRRLIDERQRQRERAALAGLLATVMSPPSRRARSREIDRPRPVPPYLRCVLPSACRNASKMIVLLVRGNADAGVAHRERARRRRTRASTRSDTSPRSVNLNAFDSRFFRICPSRCASVSIRSGAPGSTAVRQAQSLLLGDRLQRADERLDGARDRDRLGRELDLAGLDLRQIEDVVDEREQIVARREDRLRELDLLVRQVARPCCRRAASRGSATS